MPSPVRGLDIHRGPPAEGLRELRLLVDDARDPEVRRQVADQVSRLDPVDEEEAMRWIEAVTAGDDWDCPDEDATG